MTSLTLELGAKKFWREYLPGKWVPDRKANAREIDEKTKHYVFKPGSYDIEVDEATADGLIQASKEWEEANRVQKNPEGTINRMIRVKNVKRNIKPDPPSGLPPQMRQVDFLANRLGEILGELLKKSK